MVKIAFMLKRKANLTPEEFRDYYERNHAPLARRLLPLFQEYSRYFIQHDKSYIPPHMNVQNMQYDVITHITFETQADYDKHLEMLKDPELAAELSADEEKFLDRDASIFFIVEQEMTPNEVLRAERAAFAAAS